MFIRRPQQLALLCLVGGLAANATAGTNDVLTTNQPFAAVASRNVFGLNPPVATSAPAATVESLPQITLNGIASIFGEKQALFKVNVAAKSGQPARENFYILGENESQDEIEVLQIDTATASVTFKNHGVVQEFSLSLASGSAGPNSGMGPTVTAPAYEVPKSYPPEFIKARTPDYLGGGPGAIAGPDIPNRTLEQRMIIIEAQREYLKSQNDPAADTLPPTGLTPSDAFGSKNSGSQNTAGHPDTTGQ